jgi:hypothetical protein
MTQRPHVAESMHFEISRAMLQISDGEYLVKCSNIPTSERKFFWRSTSRISTSSVDLWILNLGDLGYTYQRFSADSVSNFRIKNSPNQVE